MNGVTTIRPSMTAVSDVLCRVHDYESWILNDCAIVETKNGGFMGLIFINLDEFNAMYYGFTDILHPCISRPDARVKLDKACENYESLPDNVFKEKVDWAHVNVGHRYY